MNSLPLTKGLITRSRVYLGVEKKSTIDFYVVCERVLASVKCMQIDNGKDYILTNYRRGVKAVNSDHKPLVLDVMLEVPPTKKQKIEILDYKDINSQMKFHEITSKTDIFTDSIDSMQSVSEQGNSWLRNLKAHCKRAFKTIRIRSQQIKPSKADRLIRQRIILLKKGDNLQAERLDVEIANMIFQEN